METEVKVIERREHIDMIVQRSCSYWKEIVADEPVEGVPVNTGRTETASNQHRNCRREFHRKGTQLQKYG